jgi:competence protein ComEC
MRLVAPAAGAWLAALVLLGCPPWAAYAMAGACGAAAAALLSRGVRHPPARRAGEPALAAAVLVCAAASALGVALRLTAVESGPVRALAAAGGQATLDAVVTADPVAHTARGRPMWIVEARAEAVRTRRGAEGVRVPVLLLTHDPAWAGMEPGQRVRAAVRLTVPRPGELLAAVALVRGPPEPLGAPPAVQRAADTVRARLREAASGLPPEERGVLPGMVVGDTSRLDPRVAADFKAAGLTHTLVVSGANVAITVGAVLWLARFAGLRRGAAAIFAAVALLALVVVVRPQPSVLRATVMGLIGLLALATGRERQGVPALGAAVLLLVLADPELARSYGFALSTVATAGLLVLAPRLRERLERRLPHRIAEVLAIAAAAEIACAPIVVMMSGELSLVAVVANLLAEPAVVPATLIGALTAVAAPVAMPVARLLVWPAGLAAWWIVGVARTAAHIPYATMGWPAGLPGAALLLALFGGAVLVVRHRGLRRFAAAAMAGVVVAVLVVWFVTPGWPPPGWLLVVCDVGQGDGIVLRTGPARAVVVDAGPDPVLMDRCLTELGVRTVPLLVLTHPHADHVNGVPGVRRGREIDAVLPSPLSAGEEDRFLGGLAVRTARPGQRWRIGELELTVLGPQPGATLVSTHDDGTTVNNASLVLVARWAGLSVLLPGDAETGAQGALAGSVPPVDIVKTPHHGSRSQDPGFLAASHARIAITSVGAHNDYGHPAPATLALLRALGMRTYRTDRDGSVAVFRTRNGLAVLTRN